jgi:SAM-dependent methyltransferase
MSPESSPNRLIQRRIFERALVWDWAEAHSEEDHRKAMLLSERACGMVPRDARSVLDVGCGSGGLLRALGRHGHAPVVGMDLSREALARCPGHRIGADAQHLPFRDRSFDAVACLEVIEHHAPDAFGSALSELERVAGRCILVSVPFNEDLQRNSVRCPRCRTWFHPSGHHRSFSAERMRGLFRGFRLSRIETVGRDRVYLLKRELRGWASLVRSEWALPPTCACPACDYGSPSSAEPRAPSPAASYYRLRSLFSRLAPGYARPSWFLALYERASRSGA